MKAFLDNKRDAAREIARKYNVKMGVESVSMLSEMLQPVHFRHRTLILDAGDVCADILYLVRGLVRQYHTEDDGTDSVVDIVHEGDMLVCNESLFAGQPSRLKVQTLEPTYAYEMNYKYFKNLASENKEVSTLLFAIMESVIIKKEEIYNLLDESPINKYLALMKRDSEVIRRTPLKYVASYLRMAPETLSRVRNTINKRESGNT